MTMEVKKILFTLLFFTTIFVSIIYWAILKDSTNDKIRQIFGSNKMEERTKELVEYPKKNQY